jgi:Transposase DDE domain
MKSVQLQKVLESELQAVGMRLSRAQISNLAYWSQGLATGRDCHLSNVALGVPLAMRRKHIVQRLRRSLHPVSWVRSYGCVVRHLFAHWQGSEVALVMDRTDLGHEQSLLVLGAAYRQRLLPLAWRTLPFGGTSAAEQCALLRQVKPLLPAGVRIHYYADCEFRSVAVQSACQAAQWHWQVGLKGDTYVQLADGEWQQLRTLPIVKGEHRYWQGVHLTQQKRFGPVNLLADWSVNQDNPRYWALDLPADRQAWRRGRKRFWIEPTFRDWKSYGFDLEATRLEDATRLHSLILPLALTTLWMIHIGDWLTRHGHVGDLDDLGQPDFSLFRLGRDHVQRCQTMNWSIPVGFTVSHP